MRFWRATNSIALALLFVAGCGTPYRPAKDGKGYAESQVAPNEFRVSFQGNGQTRSQEANDFALLRAAEVTLENGFRYFAVIDITNTSSARPYMERQQFYTDYPPNMGLPPPALGGSDPYRFGYIVEYNQPRIYYQPGTQLLIRCSAEKSVRPFTYDAATLEHALKQKYQVP